MIHAYAHEPFHYNFSKASLRKIKLKLYYRRENFALSEYNICYIFWTKSPKFFNNNKSISEKPHTILN